MPCDTVTTQTVALAKAVPDILRDALAADGWTIRESTSSRIYAYSGGSTVVWESGKGLTVRGYNGQQTVTRITKAYSVQAVKWSAQRAGWTVKQTADNILTVTRR